MYIWRKRFLMRSVSIFLLLTILTTIGYPTVSWAITGGPIAQEYCSFEPVDATEMVNLPTGDFTYNIPLIEIPGPEGSYPMALSYHAGITPDQEASWVGLGWSLNPGAITRYVNMYPDDHNNVSEEVHDKWDGGNTSTFSIGIGIGPVSAGLDFANDTYKGTGVGGSLGVGIGRGGASIGVTVGFGPYGGGYATVGVSLGTSAGSVQMGVHMGYTLMWDENSNFSSSFGLGVGVSIGQQDVLGANISSGQGGGGSISVAGNTVAASAGSNSNTGNIASYTMSQFFLPIWIPYTCLTINLGYSSTRYYMDQYDYTSTYGSLYMQNAKSSSNDKLLTDMMVFKNENATDLFQSNPDIEMGGSIPAYDSYSVTAQGIGGNIRPYNYENGSIFKSSNNPSADNKRNFQHISNQLGFRFVNDFSNRVIKEVPTSGVTLSSFTTNNLSTSFRNPDGSDVGYASIDPSVLNKANGYLVGSKHVEWFTNLQMKIPTNISNPNYATQKGLLYGPTTRELYFSPVNEAYQLNLNNQIGGFMVTNESGMTYHYTIPVYSFNEKSHYTSDKYQRTSTKSFPYAHAWLLTAITGPDFVDRGVIGELEDVDWGYWVKFNHGLWSDEYKWRNPYTGTRKDMDSEWSSYSGGKRQVYYLNSVETRSHIALFVKDIRRDGKGVVNIDQGGFKNDYVENGAYVPVVGVQRLSRVLLYTKKAFNQKCPTGLIELMKTGTANELIAEDNANKTFQYQLPKSILDENDLSINFSSDALREIKFNHDYSTCLNTPNSYHYTIRYPSKLKSTSGLNYTYDGIGGGKLTLNSIEFKGQGSSVLPKTEFEYYSKSTAYSKDATDIWGSYKSDYVQDPTNNPKQAQNTTQTSAAKVNTWSLSKIKTSLGSEINITYESDKYTNAVLTPFKNWAIKSMGKRSTSTSDNSLYITLYKSDRFDQYPELAVGKSIKISCLITFSPIVYSSTSPFIPHEFYDQVATIEEIDETNKRIRVDCKPICDALESFRVTPRTGYYDYPVFRFGNLFADKLATSEYLGGGLRVKTIGVLADNVEYQTNYTYTNGTTAFEPVDFLSYVYDHDIKSINNLRDKFKDFITKKYKTIIASGYFLPTPGVIYGKVSIQDAVVRNSGSNIGTVTPNGYTEHEFQTFDASILPITNDPTSSTDDVVDHVVSSVTPNVNVRTLKFKDLRNRVGLLKTTRLYDKTANKLLLETINDYLHDQTANMDRYDNLGQIDQVFVERRNNQLMVTELEEYPVVAIGQTVNDYKTNTSKVSRTLAFDFYTGFPSVFWNKNAYGQEFITENIQAYQKYPAMGHKGTSVNAKRHMLSQKAGSATYRVEAINPSNVNYLPTHYRKIGVVDANAQTWSQSIALQIPDKLPMPTNFVDVYRPFQSWHWKGNDAVALNNDGTHPVDSFDDFDFTSGMDNTNKSKHWLKQTENTKFSIFGGLLESKDLNNNYYTSLQSPDLMFTIAKGANVSYNEMAYCGFESRGENSNWDSEGNVTILEGVILNGTINNSSQYSHTGKYSWRVPKSKTGAKFTFTRTEGKRYRASVWAKPLDDIILPQITLAVRSAGSTTNIQEAHPTIKLKAGSWYLINLDIPAGADDQVEVLLQNNATINSDVFFDDFRVHPIDASMVSYVHDPTTSRLMYEIDAKNFFTRFEYDKSGKVVSTYREFIGTASDNGQKLTDQHVHYGKN